MSINIKNLKVEFMSNPVGVTTFNPKFSWQIESDEQNVVQEEYSIKVTEYKGLVIWDDTIKSSETVGIEYRGFELARDTQYYVDVTVKTNTGETASASGEFRTGLIDFIPPQIQWLRPNVDEVDYKFSPYFRREFTLKGSEIAFATAYFSAPCWLEFTINGKQAIEGELMAPGKNPKFQKDYLIAYDITKLLNEGGNAIGIQLGNGYSTNFRFGHAYHGGKRFWGYISIVFTDGSYQNIWTDESWKWSKSPILKDHIYDGEWYDARLEQPGWNEPKFNDSAWQDVAFSTYHDTMESVLVDPVIIMGTRPAVKVEQIADNKFQYDFKYNGSGMIKLTVRGEAGAEIIMTHAENIHPDGSLQYWTNRNAEATDHYFLKGEGDEVYIPRFTYHCFRYAVITVKGNAEIVSAEALVISTDMFKENSHFECSSDMLNRITDNCVRTLKTNFMTWSTDTGVRDERTPCSMDNLVYAEYAFHNVYGRNYYKRWLDILYGNGTGRPDWDGYEYVNAWFMLKYFGDVEHVAKHYPRLRGISRNMFNQFEIGRWELGFGDWTAPSETCEYEDSFSSVWETNCCMWCKEMDMMIEIAEAVGRPDDIPLYEAMRDKVKTYYIENYYNESTHLFAEGKQSPNIMAIVCGVVEGDEAIKVRDALIESIRTKDNSHLDTGIFGTRYIIEALSTCEEGKDLLFDILHQTTYPSFGEQIINRDATTIWEQWGTKLQGMMTCSHSMPTGIAVDFYRYFAGIKDMGNLYKQIKIEPIASEMLTYVNCSLETERGVIVSNWKRDENGFSIHVEIPANCEAQIVLPNGEAHTVGSGKYDF